MFDANAFPLLGVGLEYECDSRLFRPAAERICVTSIEVPELFDFVAVQPPQIIIEPKLLSALNGTRPIIHVSNLSIGSVGIPMDEEYLTLSCGLWKKTGSPWANEHISWNRFEGGDTAHFVLPSLSHAIRDTIIANALELKSRTGLPLVLENAPRTMIVNMPDDLSEGEFITSVLNDTNAGFLLDLDSARLTAATYGIDLKTYLQMLPVERTIEIHVGDPIADRALLDEIFDIAPVRAVTLHWEYRDRTSNALFRDLVDDLRNRIGVGGPQKAWSTAERPITATSLVRLAPGVAATVRDGQLRVTGGGDCKRLDLPIEALPVIGYFSEVHPLSSIFTSSICADNRAAGVAAAAVRALLDASALKRAYIAPPANSVLWEPLDVAMDFYLGTRTLTDAPFATLAEIEHRLENKAPGTPQPSAYKDYWAHPFIELPNPLTEIDGPERVDSFLDVLVRRRSYRSFNDAPVDAITLAKLLYYVWGATSIQRNDYGDVFLRKTSPSGGSLHGAEVYPLLLNVEGFEPGLYHYSVRRHGLVLLSRDDPRAWIGHACGGQHWIADSAAVFLTTFNIKRSVWKYQFSRIFRAALLDAGHLGQTFSLMATHLGLAPFTTVALRDAMFEERLGLDYLAEPIMLLTGVGISNGKPASERPRPTQPPT